MLWPSACRLRPETAGKPGAGFEEFRLVKVPVARIAILLAIYVASIAVPPATRAVSPSYSATVLADSPVSYWRLGENSGTVAADSAGANTASIKSGVTLGTAGAIANDANTATTFNGNVNAGSGTLALGRTGSKSADYFHGAIDEAAVYASALSAAAVSAHYSAGTTPPPAPVAAFSGSPTSGTAPLAVTFTDQS